MFGPYGATLQRPLLFFHVLSIFIFSPLLGFELNLSLLSSGLQQLEVVWNQQATVGLQNAKSPPLTQNDKVFDY